MPTNSRYVQQKSVPLESVAPCPLQWHKMWSGFRDVFFYICIFMNLGRENGLLLTFFFQSNCDTYLWTKEKTKSSQILQFRTNITHYKNESIWNDSASFPNLQDLWLVILPTCEVGIFWATAVSQANCRVLSTPSGHGGGPAKGPELLLSLQLTLQTSPLEGPDAWASAALARQSQRLLHVECSKKWSQTAYKYPNFNNMFFKEKTTAVVQYARPVKGASLHSRTWAEKEGLY